MRLSEFDYSLPPEFIAQEPLAERDKSKLLVLHRDSGKIEHRRFYDIPEYLRPSDLLVMNDTEVTALRLRGAKPTGGKVDVLLLRELGGNRWDALVRPGRRVNVGATILFGQNELSASVTERTEGGGRILDFGDAPGTAEAIRRLGEVPLPPYIHAALRDVSRYQTVYALEPGSAAAPTAGLHFTPELLADLRAMGVGTASITLHIGLATFRPVRAEIISEHVMHREVISIPQEAAEAVNSAQARIIAVGTTTARALESAAIGKRRIAAVDGETSLFITPGYEFKVLDALVTNFHMPRSTLLILVAAFAGRDLVMQAYEEAKKENYRFLSFGDAMLIV
ncbi:MAG TPA: tRNA preQ1(34) S-adenosylmethionine ribosyltransferase-isomerase QueA [Armatimonadota bacterium]|nr:tRNA preQ1(34) S-adenosylmethionine ribosyltransferase-isomerase QueA [Armatimonadota bacterium]